MRNLLKLSLSVFGLSQVALAAPAPAAAPAIAPYIPLVLIFAIFYFLMIRPQQKKAKEQQKFLSELKKGDMVVTSGGIIGMIKALSERFVTLEIDEGVCLKILRNQVLESANSIKDAKPA
jgi:preprotein translocase subunit YajC